MSALTEEQIEMIVASYRLQMARYENVAKYVEQRLRRELRAAAIPVLLSSRAKHPEDLRGKLRDRGERQDARYQLEALAKNVNTVVTDIAGCRVIVYDPRNEEPVVEVIRSAFTCDAEIKSHRKPSGYRATHVLVHLVQETVEASMRDAICEVQVTSIASHVFNELEHDIGYKMRDVPPGERVARNLEDLQHASRLLDNVVERLKDERAKEERRSTQPIEDGETFRVAIEQIFDRPVTGEVGRLFQLLLNTTDPLTALVLDRMALPAAAERGTARNANADDVVKIVLGLLETFQEEFLELARGWRGPTTALKRAIMETAS